MMSLQNFYILTISYVKSCNKCEYVVVILKLCYYMNMLDFWNKLWELILKLGA